MTLSAEDYSEYNAQFTEQPPDQSTQDQGTPKDNKTEGEIGKLSIQKVSTYDVSRDYNNEGGTDFSMSPSWCIAIYRLGNPVSYSRKAKKALDHSISGALLRKELPLIIESDCIQLSVTGSKSSCIKSLNATLKGNTNYLSANGILSGDWMLAWMHTNPADTQRIIKAIREGTPANDFNSGLKFIGRVQDLRKNLRVTPNGMKTITFTLQGVGFDELSSEFFYDQGLASINSKEDIFQFIGEIGLNVNKWLTNLKNSAGQVRDNTEAIISDFIDIVVGKGVSDKINQAEESAGMQLKAAPQANKEAPYAYLVPIGVATALGRQTGDSRKGDKNGHKCYGYGDLLTVLSGVQKYSPELDNTNHMGFVPDIDWGRSTAHNRMNCPEPIKGTYIPLEQCFINQTLWQIINNYKNPNINEMYTCIRPDFSGDLMPTIVYRQIPFSTNSIKESTSMPLTRFLSLPRWKIPEALVTSLDLGRSNSTHWNFIHMYGNVEQFGDGDDFGASLAAQMARHPPIWDKVDIARSGIKPFMSTSAMSIIDVNTNGAQAWTEAVADWSLGLQFTLNGTINCFGIQSPIAEGDNIEIDGIALHVDSFSHTCSISPDGFKYFQTSLNLTHGTPIDQTGATADYPRYAGFINDQMETQKQNRNNGDDSFATALNPGFTVDNSDD